MVLINNDDDHMIIFIELRRELLGPFLEVNLCCGR